MIPSILSCLNHATQSHITPENTIIVSSIDNVLIQKKWLLRYASWMNMGDEATFDRFINKLCVKLLSHSTKYPNGPYYASRVVNHIQQSYCLINDTALIYSYLREKGYTFVLTTHKDHFSYSFIDKSNGLANFASTIIVSPSEKSDNAPSLTHSTQRLDILELYNNRIASLPQNNIFIAPTNNSNTEYYDYLREKIEQKANIIFIDDSSENINAFASTQTNTNAPMTGILFETPLQLVQRCIDLGLLSVKEDTELIEIIEKRDTQFRQLLNITDWFFFAATFAPQIYTGIENIIDSNNEEKTYQNVKNADENTTHFIKQQLLKTHNISIKEVKITPSMGTLNMGLNNSNYILVSPDTAETITEALRTNDQSTLDQWRGVLEHEGNHAKNNDLFFLNIADIVSPFISRGTIALLAMMSAQLFKHKHEKRNVYRPHDHQKILIKKAILPYLNIPLSLLTELAFSRYVEQRADNQISDNITILKATKKLFESWQKPEEKQYFGETCYNWLHNFFETHPLWSTRIQKLGERIALLEKN